MLNEKWSKLDVEVFYTFGRKGKRIRDLQRYYNIKDIDVLFGNRVEFKDAYIKGLNEFLDEIETIRYKKAVGNYYLVTETNKFDGEGNFIGKTVNKRQTQSDKLLSELIEKTSNQINSVEDNNTDYNINNNNNDKLNKLINLIGGD